MAAKTQWWKHGDDERVEHFVPKTGQMDLCADCSQPRINHGKVGKRIVHPGDFIVTKDGGEIEVETPDPFAGLDLA